MSEVELHFHKDGPLVHVGTVQDVEPHLDYAKALRSLAQKSDWGRHHAHIPNVIYHQWFNEAYEKGEVPMRIFCPEMDRVVARKLKDPAYKHLLVDDPTLSGKIGWGS